MQQLKRKQNILEAQCDARAALLHCVEWHSQNLMLVYVWKIKQILVFTPVWVSLHSVLCSKKHQCSKHIRKAQVDSILFTASLFVFSLRFQMVLSEIGVKPETIKKQQDKQHQFLLSYSFLAFNGFNKPVKDQNPSVR